MKAGWDYADNGSAHVVKNQSLADDVRSRTKFALPQAFRDHGSRIGAQVIFFLTERTAHHRIYAEDFKKTCGNHFTMQAFWFTVARKIESDGAVSCHARKRGIHPPPVFKVRIGDGTIFEIGDLLKHRHELIGVAEGAAD